MIVPDSIDPIIAWRAWSFADLLGSLNNGTPVHPGVPQLAHCSVLRNHEVPAEDCTCGIYALQTLAAVVDRVRELYDAYICPVAGRVAIGQVYLWGKVVEYTEGWRAEYAYPKSILCWDTADADRLARRYNIEVESSCTWESLFEPSELNYSLSHSRYFFLPSTAMKFYGIQRVSAPSQPSPSTRRLVPGHNRSVPAPLRAQVARKEENAKSDFWKRL